MAAPSPPKRFLLVTGLSGAGRSTALDTLEDVGWEVVDNLPLSLLDPLLATPLAAGAERGRSLALGLDSRTRGFNADRVVKQVKQMAKENGQPIETLFLDCQTLRIAAPLLRDAPPSPARARSPDHRRHRRGARDAGAAASAGRIMSSTPPTPIRTR